MTVPDALARIEKLNAALLEGNSATLTLDRWCAGQEDGEQIVSHRVAGPDKPLDDRQRALLQLGAQDAVAYRRVHLRHGAHIVSVADNWYVPSRLNDDINQGLATSDIAFGRAIYGLGVRRVNLATEILWPPTGGGTDDHPLPILRHKALVLLSDGRPISLVSECYMDTLLEFSPMA